MSRHKLVSIKNISLIIVISVFLIILYNVYLNDLVLFNFLRNTPIKERTFDDLLNNTVVYSVSEKDLMSSAENKTNVALNYWIKWRKYDNNNDEWKGYGVDTCNSTIPWIEELKFSNIYWQTLSNSDKNDYFLYNAYYDNRGIDNFVRIIATQRISAQKYVWCLLYFKDKRQSIKTLAQKYETQDKHTKGLYNTVLLSCPIPKSIGHTVPKAVSLIPTELCPQKVHNSLRVIYEKTFETKQEFAVCHKALRFSTNDLSDRLIEWLELLKIFGVNKVFMPSYGVHPNIQLVLNYYKKEGFVDWKELTLPGEQPNIQYLYQLYADSLGDRFWSTELLDYSDCFYRNIHNYHLIGFLDMDEVIVPKNADNWTQMIQQINDHQDFVKESTASYEFQATRIFSDILFNSSQSDYYTYTMRHLYRGGFRDVEPPKCIHSTSKVMYVHHHNNRGCIDSYQCKTYVVNKKDGYCLHFRIGWKVRDECKQQNQKTCINFDPILLRHRKTFETNVKNVSEHILN